MPFGSYNMGQKPVQFLPIVNQLFKQAAQIPAIQDIADIENDGDNFCTLYTFDAAD